MFQNLLMEADPTILTTSQATWTALLAAVDSPTFTTSASPLLTSMLFDLSCIPTGHVLPPNKLLRFPMPASGDALLPAGSRPGQAKHVVGSGEGFDVAKMRLAAAQALGQMAYKFAASGNAL